MDISALTWVQGEIEQSFTRGLESLQTFRQSPSDRSPLQRARAHFRQGVGAIQMVGLEALAAYAVEIEGALERLGDAPESVIAPHVECVDSATRKLLIFLSELSNGAPLSPLILFPHYEALQKLRNVKWSNPADLFFPDVSIRVPDDGPQVAITQDQFADFLIKKRRAYEHGLLDFLRGSMAGADHMEKSVSAIADATPQHTIRTFWFTVAALLDAIKAGKVERSFALQHLLARVDLQIRRVVEGSANVAERLRRETLYFVALDEKPSSDRVKTVQRVFNLAELLPKPGDAKKDVLSMYQVIRDLRAHVNTVKSMWARLIAGQAEQFADLRQELLFLFKQSAKSPYPEMQLLFGVLGKGSESLDPHNVPDSVGMEYATALLFAEDIFAQYGNPVPELAQQINAIRARINAALKGEALPSFDLPRLHEISQQAEDKILLPQLAEGIQTNLRRMEQELDVFFRDNTKRENLASLQKDGQEISGALRVLGRDDADALLTFCLEHIASYDDTAAELTNDDFELLAESLSALGFYIESLQQQRSQSMDLITPLIERYRERNGLPPDEPTPDKPAKKKETEKEPKEPSGETLAAGGDHAMSSSSSAVSPPPPSASSPFSNSLSSSASSYVMKASPAQYMPDYNAFEDTLGNEEVSVVDVASSIEGVPSVLHGSLSIEDAAIEALLPMQDSDAPVSPIITQETDDNSPIISQSPVESPDKDWNFPQIEGIDIPAVEATVSQEDEAAFDAEEFEAPDTEVQPLEVTIKDSVAELMSMGHSLLSRLNDEDLFAQITKKVQLLGDDAKLISDESLQNKIGEIKRAMAGRPRNVVAGLLIALTETPKAAPSEEAKRLMTVDAEALDDELLDIFLEEANDVLDSVEDNRATLKKNPNDIETLRAVRRAFHTLKGSGRMVGLKELGEIAYDVEKIHNQLLENFAPVTDKVWRMIEVSEQSFRGWIKALISHKAVTPDPTEIHRAIEEVVEEMAPRITSLSELLSAKTSGAKSTEAPPTPVTPTVTATSPSTVAPPGTATPAPAPITPTRTTHTAPIAESGKAIGFSSREVQHRATNTASPVTLSSLSAAATRADDPSLGARPFDAGKADVFSTPQTATVKATKEELTDGFTIDVTRARSAASPQKEGGASWDAISINVEEATPQRAHTPASLAKPSASLTQPSAPSPSSSLAFEMDDSRFEEPSDDDEVWTLMEVPDNDEMSAQLSDHSSTLSQASRLEPEVFSEDEISLELITRTGIGANKGIEINLEADTWSEVMSGALSGVAPASVPPAVVAPVASSAVARGQEDDDWTMEFTNEQGERVKQGIDINLDSDAAASNTPATDDNAWTMELTDEQGGRVQQGIDIHLDSDAAASNTHATDDDAWTMEFTDEQGQRVRKGIDIHLGDDAGFDETFSAGSSPSTSPVAVPVSRAMDETSFSFEIPLASAFSGVSETSPSDTDIEPFNDDEFSISIVTHAKSPASTTTEPAPTPLASHVHADASHGYADESTIDDLLITSSGTPLGVDTSYGIGIDVPDDSLNARFSHIDLSSLEIIEHDHDLVEALPGEVAEEESLPDASLAAVGKGVQGKPAENVYIGNLTISRTLFDLFTEEAAGYWQTLGSSFSLMQVNESYAPTEEMIRAAHTLAGIHGTTGFPPVFNVAKALEHVLNAAKERANANAAPVSRMLPVIARAISGLRVLMDRILVKETFALSEEREAEEIVEELETLLNGDLAVGAEIPVSQDAAITKMIEKAHAVEDDESDAGDSKEPSVAEVYATQKAFNKTAAEQAARKTDVDPELLAIFLEEAQELLESSHENFQALVGNPADKNIALQLKRNLHTIKGSARMVGAMKLGDTAHQMETALEDSALDEAALATIGGLLIEVERGVERLRLGHGDEEEEVAVDEAAATGDVSDTSLGADEIEPIRAVSGEGVAGTSPLPVSWQPEDKEASFDVALQLARERARVEQQQKRVKPVAVAPEEGAFLRVSASRVDRLVNEAGEIIISRTRAEGELRDLKNDLAELTNNVLRLRQHLRVIEIEAESRIQAQLENMQDVHGGHFDPLEFDRFTLLQETTRSLAEGINDVSTIQQSILTHLDAVGLALLAQSRMSRDMQQTLFSVRTVPFSSVTERLQRIVRSLTQELQKQADLEIVGGQNEIDRAMLERLIAPLDHLLRNALDHGVDSPEERLKDGKPERAKITINVHHASGEIVIAFSDDGRGINREKLRNKLRERGEDDTQYDDNALLNLVFDAGFSTAKSVTAISGRGIGLDIVKNEVLSLGGRVEVESVEGKGTTFLLCLPLTVSVVQVMLVQGLKNRVWAINSPLVEQVDHVSEEKLAEMYKTGKAELRGETYPFYYFNWLLDYTEVEPETKRYNSVAFLSSGHSRVAVHVDQVIGNQEIVVKSAGTQFLRRINGFVGATIMGTGEIVLIVNPAQLAQRRNIMVPTAPELPQNIQEIISTPAPVEDVSSKTILVVDDSLTVRKVTSRLLTREGFNVSTAKDGFDALKVIGEHRPDLILLDIEMPKMDGFEFAKLVKGDEVLKSIPIIMITSRTADKHRRRAFELGVNGYLGKPYQEDELIEHIRDLLAHPTRSM
jgi:chemotaxis protein histidine kinase CheA/CheY-like chemotaxis protein